VVSHPVVLLAGGFLLIVVFAAMFAPLIVTHDPQLLAPAKRMAPISGDYWFGADLLGRDVFSRVIYGARVSLSIGAAVAVVTCCAGLLIGMFASFNRAVDSVVMRVMDALMAIPSILLAIALMALSGP
jgi:peptide/nickel transport system permease protein